MKRVEQGAKPKAKRASRASGAHKPAAKARKTAKAKPVKMKKGAKVAVLSGGNPQITNAQVTGERQHAYVCVVFKLCTD